MKTPRSESSARGFPFFQTTGKESTRNFQGLERAAQECSQFEALGMAQVRRSMEN
jgi:hypothetical protein